MHFTTLILKSSILLATASRVSGLTEAIDETAKTFKFAESSAGLYDGGTTRRLQGKSFKSRNGGITNNALRYDPQSQFRRRFGRKESSDESEEEKQFVVGLAPAPPLVMAAFDSSEDGEGDENNASFRTPAAHLLKSMNARVNDVDDLEEEYADQFLKKGLVMAGDFDGYDNKYDEQFIKTLKKFYASLMQRTSPMLPEISSKWRVQSGESVYKTPRLYTKSKSIDCGNLQMRLKMVGIIYDGHRNRVIKLFDRSSKKTFAYKTYGNPDEFYAEQEKFLWLDHPYFVKAVCHRKDMDSGKAGILFEYVEGTSSMEYARNATPEQLKRVSAQLFLALEHLHWLGIVHADMKPENVLITADGIVQVIDLGFATHLPQSKRRRGTHTTMAPELHYLVPGRVHEAIDWWAYGSTIAMWYAANHLYRNDDGRRFIPMNWQDGRFIDGTVPWRFPQELRNFLQIFFQPNPEHRRIHTRRLLKQIRSDEFFDGLDWSSLYGGLLDY